MADDSGGDRTEQPTARRRADAREQGQVPRSQDLTASLGLFAGVILLWVFGKRLLDGLLQITHELGGAPILHAGDLTGPVTRIAWTMMSMLLPFMGALLLFTVLGVLVQFGILFTPKKLKPDLNNLSPMKGIKQMFSKQAFVRLGMGVLKMVIVAAVAYYTIVGEIGPVLSTGGLYAWAILAIASDTLYTLALRLAIVLFILGILDYVWQRYQHEEQLKMTKQEVRDEMKRMDGDPHVKRRQREHQMRIAMQRINTDVPQADVIVTNPTEYSVAIKYDEDVMEAPRVVAKGKDILALRIRQVAMQHGVPIVQRPPLARALYAQVEPGQEIPATFYKAVAEVLAYVYQLSGRATRAG